MRAINVIDMSHHNFDPRKPTPDFKMLKAAGVYGIIFKATQGIGYIDSQYQKQRQAIRDAGLLHGAYHFMDGSSAKDQAAHFLDTINDLGFEPCLVACDYEDSDHPPALHQMREFVTAVDQFMPGVSCALYSGNRIRETARGPSPGGHLSPDMAGIMQFLQDHRLWLAEYGPHLNVPWPWNQPIVKSGNEATPAPAPGVFLWQFTEKGHVNPLTGNTDGNFFDGTFEELQARWLA